LSFLILFPTTVFIYLLTRKSAPNDKSQQILSYGLLSSIVIPLVLVIVGKFPTYYSWMVYVPLSVAAVSAAAELESRYKPLVLTFFASACLIGLPFQLAVASYDWADRSHVNVISTISAHVTQNDRVLTDYGAYYAVKNITPHVYTPQYTKRLTTAEKESLSLLVASDAFYAKAIPVIGGRWTIIGEIKPQKGLLTEQIFGNPIRFGMFDRKYDLKIYRRQS